MDNGNDSDRTTSASPPPIDSVTPPLSPPQPMVSSVVLGTVTEEPTRFEDFLLAQGCKIRNNSIIGDNRIQQNNGDGRSGVIGPIPQKPAGANTLELTLYNNGRKESEKEFRPHMKEQDVRYFENQQLQLSRVIREPGHVHPQVVGNRSQITNQNNTHHFPRHKQHGNNNNITNNTSSQIFAQPHLKLTNSIIKNLNTNVNSNRTSVSNNSCNDNNGKTWEQIGLKISRCQRDERRVITVENDISGERAPEKTLALDGEPIRDKGEDEILIERHLQAYLTSLKYVKPGPAEHNNKVEAVPEFRGRSITHGLSGIAPQAIRVASPCEPAQITRIPNVRPPTSSPASAQQQHHHSEAWPERTIARIPAKPYLGRDIPRELPQQQIYPPAKRFRANGNMPQTNRQIMPRQQVNNQQQITTITPHQQQQYISAHNTNAIPNGDVDKNPALRNQLVHCASLRQQLQQHPISYHASSTVPAPQHSPSIAQAHAQQQYHHHQLQQQQQQQKYPNNAAQQQQLEESRIFLAALAAGGEGLDSAYCERLRRYWEYYQTREVDWAKLSEYYQKYNFYPWDILSARDESIRQWRQQQQQSVVTHPQLQVQLTPQIDGRPIELENLTQQQQHQLALRAMNLAAVNYANSRSHHSEASAASSPASISMHNRIAGMDVSPPSTSPLPAQVQNKYNHNSQQLQQLQQLHHQKHLSLQQQQQVQQQQKQQHNQRLRYTQEQHHQQQLHQQKAQQVVLMANQKLQHSANYYSAYNQLAAAAAAISSSYSNSQNQPRLSPHQQPPRENNIPPIVLLDEEKDNEAEDIPVPVNIHRQTLELAMKNNFKNRSNNNSQPTISASNIINAALASQQYPNRNNNNVVRVRKDIVVAPSQTQPQQITAVIPPHHHPHPHHQQQQHQQRTLPKNGNGSNNICSVNGAINMTKESLRTTSSSPNSSSQSTVIRRLRILQPKMPASYASPSATVQQTTSTNETVRASVQNSLDNSDAMQPMPLVLHKNNQYGRSNEYATSHGDNRNVDGKRNGGNQQHSPLPMVAGEEEVIANVSPSAILSNYDDMTGENDNNVDEKDPYNNSSDTPEPGDGGGSWQYDHVVLLDKYILQMLQDEKRAHEGSTQRIKTYMCKRCFETLKTEQEIRNHLFCKMLANHVQCHVCLQLFTSDAYPAHLQIHGVRPLEDAQSDD